MPKSPSDTNSTKYRMKLKRTFDRTKSEYIILKITVSDELRQLIKSATIDELIEEPFRLGEINMDISRYKIKKWIYSSMPYTRYKALIFHQHLMDKGELRVEFDSVRVLEDVLSMLKENVKAIIQTVLNYSDIDMTVSFGVEK